MSAQSRQELEKARTLPIAEARQPALGMAKTQQIRAASEPTSEVDELWGSAPAPAPAQPRRVRPVAALPTKPMAAVRPIAEPVKPITPIRPIAEAVKPLPAPPRPIAASPKPIAPAPTPIAPAPKPSVQVSAPAVSAGIMPAAAPVDDGWAMGRKRNRAEAARPLRKIAEGTQPGLAKVTQAVPKAAGKHAAATRPATAAAPATAAERKRLAEGSLPPPPTAGKPLPSLFSVIDRKKPETQSSAPPSRLPGLPPPPPARPTIGPKKAVSTVVAAASLGSAQMAIATTRQTGEQTLVPPPAAMILDDEDVEELEEIEEDLPDFVPPATEVAGVLMRAKSAPTPLFDAPRTAAMPAAATSFSAAERAFFAAGEEMDTLDMEGEPDTFDDLPGVERPSFWSRLKNRGALAGG